jgi:hypothetical protein
VPKSNAYVPPAWQIPLISLNLAWLPVCEACQPRLKVADVKEGDQSG